MSCFSQEDFQKLLAGELTVEEELIIDRHLSDCLQCREQLAALTEDSPLAARICAGLSSILTSFDNPDVVASEAVSKASQIPPTESLGHATICDHQRPAPLIRDTSENVERDREFLRRLSENVPFPLTIDDVADRDDENRREDEDDEATFDRAPAPPTVHFPVIPGLVFEKILGEGGMGVVFKAYDERLRRPVAVKLLRHAAGSQDLATRLRREAEAAARLNHPNVVQVYSVGESKGLPYVVMEYVGGGTLNERLQGQPQPPAAAARVIRLLAEAVDFAHQRAVIHRDLKPRNILLESRVPNIANASWEEITPKVADFGLAKLQDQDHDATRTGQMLGTPAYAAPEQLQPARDFLSRNLSNQAATETAAKIATVGPAADIYSLGVLLYLLLTGRPPLQAEDLLRTIKLVLDVDPLPPQRLQPGVPRDLQTICLCCLEKDPSKRYASAAALADDLGRFLAGEPIVAKPPTLVGRLWHWSLRNRLLASMEAAAVLLLAALVIGAVSGLVIFSSKNQELVVRYQDLDASNVKYQRLYIENKKALEDAKAAKELSEQRKTMADDAASKANEQRERADKAAADAVMLAAQTEMLAEKAANENYFSLIAAANLSLQYSESRLMRDYLARCVPANGEHDRRGWEWRYLHGIRGGELLCWDLSNALEPQWLPRSLIYSPDGKWLALIACRTLETSDGRVLLWDANSMRLARYGEFTGAPNWHDVVFSQDGQRLIFINVNNVPQASWRIADGVLELDASRQRISRRFEFVLQAILTSPRPTKMGIVLPRDPGVAKLSSFYEHPQATIGTVRDDGKVAATASSDGSIEIWRVDTSQKLQRLLSDARPIRAIALSPLAPLVVTIAHDRILRLWDLSRPDSHIPVPISPFVGSFLGAASLPQAPQDAAKPPDTVPADGQTSPLIAPPAIRAQILDFAFSQDEQHLERIRFAPEHGLIVDAARIETGETHRLRWLSTAVPHRTFHDSTYLNEDGTRFAVPQWYSPAPIIASGETASGEMNGRVVNATGRFDRHWVSPSGKTIATIQEGDTEVKLWDAVSGELLRSIAPPSGTENAAPESPIVTFDPWRQRLALHYGRMGVSLVPLGDGARYDRIAAGITGSPAPCAFAPNGTWLAITPSDGRQIVLVDISTPAQIPKPEFLYAIGSGSASDVMDLAFSPDTSQPRLAIVNRAGEVDLWSPKDRRLVLRLGTSITALDSVANYRSRIRWSRSGQKLAVDRANGTIDVWDAPSEQTVEKIRRSALREVATSPTVLSRTPPSPADQTSSPAHDGRSLNNAVADELRTVLTRNAIAEVQILGEYSAKLRGVSIEVIRELQAEHLRLAFEQSRLVSELSPWTMTELGFVYAAKGEWNLAADAWCPPSDPSTPRTAESYDRAYLTARQILASDVPLAELEKHCPQFLELELEKRRLMAKDQPRPWRELLEKRVETDPRDPIAARRLAEILFDEVPESEFESKSQLKLLRGDPRTNSFTLLAAAQIAHGNIAAALEILAKSPPSPTIDDRQRRDRLLNILQERGVFLP
jgi:serine/threonine protein kinase/WD40 repeat protein